MEDVIGVLPPQLHKFFWDVDPVKIDLNSNAHFVINRLLDKGDLDGARWVLKTYPRQMIVDTFKTTRDFSPWNGMFWMRYFDIPKEEMLCLDPRYLKQRRKHWHY